MDHRDLRAETIYFIVIDRFHNGDADNDIGDNPACSDPTRQNWLRYWGGDLQGIVDKLDYLVAIGATSLWLTPIFDQIDALSDDGGRLAAPYHGYWPKDYKRIDEHLLPRAERHASFGDRPTLFDRLLELAHARGLRIILDVPINHTNAGGEGVAKGELYDDGVLLTTYDDDRLGWYHKDGPIDDWDDPHELVSGELRGLADLDEDVWTFRRYITDTMAAWLERGVDGFRLDAVKHVSFAFWQEFCATLRQSKTEVILFGEWAGSGPWDARSVHFANNSGMSLLDFGFHYAAADVLCKGAPWSRFAELIRNDHVYDDATELITFLDNHDMARLLSRGLSAELMPLALTLLVTSRGVPCVYYGTEELLHDDTEGGNDPYNRPMMQRWDTTSPPARALARLSLLRRKNLALQRGFTREILVGPDVFVFARRYDRDVVLVALNRGARVTLELEGVLLPDGDYRDELGVLDHAIHVEGETIHALPLPRGAALVLAFTAPRPPIAARAQVTISLSGYSSRYGERVVMLGSAPELGRWDPTRARPLHYVNPNLWIGDLPLEESAGADLLYRFAIIDASGAVLHEDRIPRVRKAPLSGVVTWKDRWQA